MGFQLGGKFKSVCESVLVHAGVPGMYRSLGGDRGVVLAYHNVVPDDLANSGDRSLHLSLSSFRSQLDILTRCYDIVPLDAILDRPVGSGRRPVAAITFDDAYLGAATLAVAELSHRRLPATLFVTPAFVGSGEGFWWDILANEDSGELAPDVRRHAIEELRGDQHAILEWARSEGLRLRTPPAVSRCATTEVLDAATRHVGITLAPHGWSHRNLTSLSRRELETEIRRPLEWLRERFSPVLPWLSYPYGAFNSMVAGECARGGYAAALGIGTGPVPAVIPNRFALPRVSVPSGVTMEGFVIRAAGVIAA